MGKRTNMNIKRVLLANLAIVVFAPLWNGFKAPFLVRVSEQTEMVGFM
jgi:hypothetical protein